MCSCVWGDIVRIRGHTDPIDNHIAVFKQWDLVQEKQPELSLQLSCVPAFFFFLSFLAQILLLLCPYMAGDTTTNSSQVWHLFSGDTPRLKVESLRPNHILGNRCRHWSVKGQSTLRSVSLARDMMSRCNNISSQHPTWWLCGSAMSVSRGEDCWAENV